MSFEEFEEMRLRLARESRQLTASGWSLAALGRYDLRRNGYPRKLSLREVEYLEMLNAPVESLFT